MLARRLSFVLAATCALATLPAAAKAPAPSPAPSLAPSGDPAPASSGSPDPSASGAPNRNTAAAAALSALANSLAQRAAAPLPYAVFVKGATVQPGVIGLIQKEDDLFLDLPADAFGKTYLIAPTLATSIAGDDAAFTGRLFDPLVVRFERVGRRVLWVEPNENYTAPAGSSEAASLAVSVTDSVLNATPIVAEDDTTKHVVIPAAFFLSDVENVGRDLAGRAAPTLLNFGGAPRAGYAIDATRSYIESAKALPANDEITANLGFSGQGADQPPVADARNLRVRMHYSILEAPALGSYHPRYADDRVGYFTETFKRLGQGVPYPSFAHYVERRDTSSGPIVYYLSNEIPGKYRETVRSAILAWNDAFARIGMPKEVEVRDAPADGSFDPDDIRYSVIRWVTGEGSARVAFGPNVADPRTGQILRGEVVIDGETIAAFDRGYGLTALPLHESVRTAIAPASCIGANCADDDEDEISSATLGLESLIEGGASPTQRDAYVRGFLRWVVMHEVGHTLGLSHNFAGSDLYSLAQLHDPRFTAHHQLSASVMDYLPVNLSPKGKPQGAYFQDQIGAYDRWAIRYGYEQLPFSTPEAEIPALQSLASESTRPEYDFESDEDAAGPQAIDPRVNAYDLSSDPLQFAQNQFAIDDQLLDGLDASMSRSGANFDDERVAFITQIRDYARSAAIVGKYVGGAYVSRDHRGQSGGQPPVRPIPRAVSQQAFTVLDRSLFSSKAFRFSPELLSHLGYDHFGGWGNVESRPDYPAVELLAELQDSVLIDVLLAPATASRLEESEYRERSPGETMSLHDLFTWMHDGIFDDLGPSVRSTNVVHRGLQRRYVRYLTELALAPGSVVEAVGYPGDMSALARQQLAYTADELDRSLRTGHLDDTTAAHREDLLARIRRALNPDNEAQP